MKKSVTRVETALVTSYDAGLIRGPAHTPMASLMDLAKSRVAIERSFGRSFVGRSLPHHGSGADG